MNCVATLKVPQGGLIPMEVTNAGSQETALIMEIGVDIGPGANDAPMLPTQRAQGLLAMVRCGARFSTEIYTLEDAIGSHTCSA
jgi:hypothetical protein